MLTSPVSPVARKKKPARKEVEIDESDEFDDGYDLADFIVSDNDDNVDFTELRQNAFEQMKNAAKPKPKPRQLETRGGDFGPPILADHQMGKLTDIHYAMVIGFVEEAKHLEEKIRNKVSARKSFFTEAHLREMAIRWTLNVVAMKNIPGINADRVHEYGKQFIPLVQKYNNMYNERMNEDAERDMDPNHRNVVNLLSDDDEEDMLEDEVEEQSAYFANAPPPQRPPPTSNLPWAPNHVSSQSTTKNAYAARSTFTKGKGRAASRKGSSRKSYGSNSGVSSGGVSKRRSSGGAKKARSGPNKAGGSSSSKPSFARNSGGSGGGRNGGSGGGGIGMMPT